MKVDKIPSKVVTEGIRKKKTTPKVEVQTTPVSESTEIPISEMEKMAVGGTRTEKKRKYNKSKFNNPKPPFGFS
jgi:hypothetical protein